MGGSKTVLVAADDAQLLRLLVRLLERAGHRVLPASNSAAAIEWFRTHAGEIDLVLLDVGLEPDGIQKLLDAMRKARPDLGVILASGDPLPDEIVEPLAEIGGVFLHKPFPPPALLRAVAEAQDASVKIG